MPFWLHKTWAQIPSVVFTPWGGLPSFASHRDSALSFLLKIVMFRNLEFPNVVLDASIQSKFRGLLSSPFTPGTSYHTLLFSYCTNPNLALSNWGLPRWLSGKESVCQCRRCRRCGLDPWVRTFPWRRKWQPTPVFLSGKSHGQRNLVGYRHGVAKSQT